VCLLRAIQGAYLSHLYMTINNGAGGGYVAEVDVDGNGFTAHGDTQPGGYEGITVDPGYKYYWSTTDFIREAEMDGLNPGDTVAVTDTIYGVTLECVSSPSCATNALCEVGEVCSLDCTQETHCDDGVDNDQDGDTDGDDSDCDAWCEGCALSTDGWMFSVTSLDPAPCPSFPPGSCGDFLGDFTVSLGGGSFCPGGSWCWEEGTAACAPIAPVYSRWQLEYNSGTNRWELQASDGQTALYINDTSWNCQDYNVMTYVSDNTECSEWPSTIAVIPTSTTEACP